MTKTLENRIINTMRKAIAESVIDVLEDPDYGLELSEKVCDRLSRIRGSKRRKTISFDKVYRRVNRA